jgi:cytochrome d ubiquinol oxidase subunit II
MLDYETLKLIWWLLVGALFIGYAITDGFDLGAGILLPFIAKNDVERRMVLSSISPTWDGNQVWLITAGGALFAAWPLVYAASFSAFYLAMILVLFTLLFRPPAFDFRNKLADPKWRFFWDWAMFVACLVPTLIFGVAIGNLLQGVPLEVDDTMHFHFAGSFFMLLNPFALYCGLAAIAMIAFHGAVWVALKTTAPVEKRAIKAARLFALLFIVLFIGGGFLIQHLQGFLIIDGLDPQGVANPLLKTVSQKQGAWLENFKVTPAFWAAPAAALLGSLLAMLWVRSHQVLAFIASALVPLGAILTFGFAIFPFIMPSSVNPNISLTIWDATSSYRTLLIMFFATVIFLPLVTLYTAWVYRVLRGKITQRAIEEGTATSY